ncbi:hypothetical protein Z517_10637 [Fonsecaea pedrosoi CBS 271.37]|uniref:Uncharacterized protein n=1 Tax=Fonsecaea pedrosoi CBS 271.37 TaxID=1442368 RepID=A0A0D2END1_9EURO|nr:uncharacterized protein Z517_10637 [Fonsecaea pedrosoi CBS 271.37]KIW75892.1 hypothetical protein Z517_10637 [Fonsecaea pedrosoi CBS 271.37]
MEEDDASLTSEDLAPLDDTQSGERAAVGGSFSSIQKLFSRSALSVRAAPPPQNQYPLSRAQGNILEGEPKERKKRGHGVRKPLVML